MLEKNDSELLRSRLHSQQEQLQREQPEVAERRQLSPFAQMDRLFDEIFKRPFFSLWANRMGEESDRQIFLPVDVFEDNESVTVRAEIPGVSKEDVSVQLSLDSITISGKKSNESRVQEKDYFRMESSYGSFSRTCHLPSEVVVDKARAQFKDGVLEVRIPKSPESSRLRSRKLSIE
jgi:HSP20 family protein